MKSALLFVTLVLAGCTEPAAPADGPVGEETGQETKPPMASSPLPSVALTSNLAEVPWSFVAQITNPTNQSIWVTAACGSSVTVRVFNITHGTSVSGPPIGLACGVSIGIEVESGQSHYGQWIWNGTLQDWDNMTYVSAPAGSYTTSISTSWRASSSLDEEAHRSVSYATAWWPGTAP